MDRQSRDLMDGLDRDHQKGRVIPPLTEALNFMRSVADDEVIFAKMKRATQGGYIQLIPVYLRNYAGELQVREALQRAREEWLQMMAPYKIQSLWLAEWYRMTMGISLKMLYDLHGLPDPHTKANQLEEFLENDAFTHEMLSLMKLHLGGAELHDWRLIQYKYALQHGFDDYPAETAELERANEEIVGELHTLIPLAATDLQNSHVHVTARPGATVRAFNFRYVNEQGVMQKISVINGNDRPYVVRKGVAHEDLGHKLHALLIAKMAEVGAIKSGRLEQVYRDIREAIAGLAERGVANMWPEAGQAYLDADNMRYTTIQGLIQNEVRTLMEQLWNDGHQVRQISLEQANTILETLNEKVQRWSTIGMRIKESPQIVPSSINTLNPMDYLVYQRFDALDEVFTKRFGSRWMENQDARLVWYRVNMQSWQNNIEELIAFVHNPGDIGALRSQILNMGIPGEML